MLKSALTSIKKNFIQTRLTVTPAMASWLRKKAIPAARDSEDADVKSFRNKAPAELLAIRGAIERYGMPKNLRVGHIPGMGNAIFLASTSRPIAKGAFIGEYMGDLRVVRETQRDNHSAYMFELANRLQLTPSEFSSLQSDGYIAPGLRYSEKSRFWLALDAEHSGNFTRWINGTTSEHANVRVVLRIIKDGGVETLRPVLVADREIRPGEQLLYDYGPNYWNAFGIQPKEITASTYTFR